MTLRRVVLLIALGVGTAFSAEAQSISGIVTDETTGRPLAGATVRLLTPAGEVRATTLTDRGGAWTFVAPATGGEYRLQVERPGYAIIETATFLVGASPIAMNLSTRPQVVMLEGITAQQLAYLGVLDRMSSRKSARTLLPDEVALRMPRAERWGTSRLVHGLIATVGIEGAQDWPIFYSVPLMTWRAAPRGLSFGRSDFRSPWDRRGLQERRKCDAIIAIDGIPNFKETPEQTVTDLVPLSAIRAVEIYPDPNFLPLELQLEEKRSRLDPELDCGVVVIWTSAALGLP